MERTSKTLGRIGVAAVGALTFLATPAIGVISASAAPATLTPISPWNGAGANKTISAMNDGTNSAIHLEALLNQATGADPTASAVRFSYCVDDTANPGNCVAAPVVIATDSSAPYSTEWTPPSTITNGSIVHVVYEAISSSNTVLDTHTLNYTLDNSKSTVHISSPPDGGSIGVWNDGNTNLPANGTFIASGTMSSDNPTVAVNAFESNGTTSPGAGTVTRDTTAHTWTGLVPAPAFTSTDSQRRVEATANTSDSDEEIVSNFYAQTLPSSGFAVTPPSQTAGIVAGSATSGNYTVTAKDQNGQPIANLNVIIKASGTIAVKSGDTTDAPTTGDCATNTCALTDINGQVKFTDTLLGATGTTDNITVESDKNGDGSYDSATDESRTVTFTSYNATPTTLSTTATPSQSSYAPSEYTAAPAGSGPVTFNSSGTPTGGSGTPFVRVHVVDQNGNALTDTLITNFNYEVDRSLSDGTTTGSIAATACNAASAKDIVGSCTTDDNGDIYLPHAAAPSTGSGSDTFKAWIEKDGQAGETAGDVKAGNLTLNFAGSTLVWNNCATTTSGNTCNTQAPLNTPETYTVHSAVGGSARNGDTITFTTTGGILTVAQPAGTIRDDANDAHCVSGQGGAPSGGCSITVNSAVAQTVTVTAHDTTLGTSSDLVIDFRSNSLDFRQADNVDEAVVRPVASNGDQSTENGCFSDQVNVGRPGDVVIAQYQLMDINGNALANVTGTATLDHGYFTNIPKSYDQTASESDNNVSANTIPWSDVTLNGTPGAGTKIGSESGQVAPKANASTLSFQTDNQGIFTMAVSIGRDPQFDQNGNVTVSPKVTVGTQSFTLAPINDEYDWCDGLYGHADNIGAGHISDATDFPGYTFSTDASHHDGSGYYNAAGTNALTFTEVNGKSLTGYIPTSQTRSVAAWTRDSFGNLTRSGDNAIEVDSTGVGTVNGNSSQTSITGSYTDPGTQDLVTIQNGGCTDPLNPCGTPGHQDVKGTWDVHEVVYTSNGATPPVYGPQINGPAINCTDPSQPGCTPAVGPVTVASLDWYTQAVTTANGATYTFTTLPASANNSYATGTTVSVQVNAKDQHGQPIIGLPVSWHRGGPGSASDDQQACTIDAFGDPVTVHATDQNGKATYTFTGATAGTAQVTGIVYDNCSAQNELARGTQAITFAAGGGGGQAGPGTNPAYHSGNTFVLGNLSGATVGSTKFGNSTDKPVWGDWDGNGTASAGVFRAGTWYLSNDNHNTAITVNFGQGGDVPLVGDWDGNGTSTIGVYRPSTGTFFIANSLPNGGTAPISAKARFGNIGDKPLVGDWEGDGHTRIGVYRPSTATFYRLNHAGIHFGNRGDRAVAGDWNGDGTTTIGVIRGAQWLLTDNNASVAHSFTFGSQSSDFTYSTGGGSAAAIES